MVKPDEIKVKNYEEQIHSKLKECENEEERQAYKDYCISECLNWDLDVNYHKAVENVFCCHFFTRVRNCKLFEKVIVMFIFCQHCSEL